MSLGNLKIRKLLSVSICCFKILNAMDTMVLENLNHLRESCPVFGAEELTITTA